MIAFDRSIQLGLIAAVKTRELPSGFTLSLVKVHDKSIGDLKITKRRTHFVVGFRVNKTKSECQLVHFFCWIYPSTQRSDKIPN